MTRRIASCDLVARYPVAQWGRSGKGAFTAQSWRELALDIAKNDEENLCEVMGVAIKQMNKDVKMDQRKRRG
eukprot:3785067-Pyramimonas_sp.AAC.1